MGIDLKLNRSECCYARPTIDSTCKGRGFQSALAMGMVLSPLHLRTIVHKCQHAPIMVDPRINETLQTGAVRNRTYRIGVNAVQVLLFSWLNCLGKEFIHIRVENNA